MERKVWAKELIDSLSEQYRVLGSMDRWVKRAASMDQADEESLSFCRKKGEPALEMIRSSRAKVIVCYDGLDFSEAECQDKTLIQVSNPRLTFCRLLRRYFASTPEPGIHHTAVIDKKAKIGRGVYIGPYSYVGECEVGEGTIIEGNVYVHDGARIGKGVIIHPGAVIGSEAIAFERNERGELEKFPQIGGVLIEDDVEIGTNTHIARGALNDTVIGKGTKLDVLVEVGHGVRVGKHCVIVALTAICGRVIIGDYTWIAPHVSIKEGITIGNRVLVGMGSVVTTDIPDNMVVMGAPAKPVRENVL